MSFWNALVRRHAPASKASNICFRTNLKMIPHMQLADNPGRHEPGTGEINYKFLFEFIDKIGYTGWIGCEYKPLTTTDAGLSWIARLAKLT